MAFECKDNIGYSSPNNCNSSSWDKEPVLVNPKTQLYNLCATTTANSSRKHHSKSIISQPVSALPSEQVDSKSNSNTTADDSARNGNKRSFNDLPPALVCEILQCLDAKELGIVSCVSTLLNSLASDHHGWKNFYCERWGMPPLLCSKSVPVSGTSVEKSWKDMFVEREFRSRSFMGRYSIDVLHGHTEAVRAVFLLQSAKLIFTAGYDSVVRMWDMEEGLSIAASRSLGCTIRAIVADSKLLVASGTDAFLQCWQAVEGNTHLFDITGSTADPSVEFRLWGHEGPVTCLALDSARIYSGSWDMSIRVWDRSRRKCLRTLKHGDWVWALAPRGSTIASTAGRDAYIWDIQSGEPITVISNAHVGNAFSLTRSHLGNLLFTGGEDGTIHMFEINEDCDCDDIKPAVTWVPHTGPVHSLTFEYPWLVSAGGDGRIALIDVRKLLIPSQKSSLSKFSGFQELSSRL
uniref:F-box domain-containing protein n=1 Tax=Ananas comosus var. bracteatus TaxID=296719 RepID=A0A6V7QYH6_ANACO